MIRGEISETNFNRVTQSLPSTMKQLRNAFLKLQTGSQCEDLWGSLFWMTGKATLMITENLDTPKVAKLQILLLIILGIIKWVSRWPQLF